MTYAALSASKIFRFNLLSPHEVFYQRTKISQYTFENIPD